ncbi:hypothetical protein H112_00246 [Trichophyton rubrum D6]|uniref:Uncharacterized protein n=4 Tax=Trichophyton TaxID=5550 RepID=A0A178EWM6_TRIRU|nr:uncharacterized protein TERG_08387 [Trichophyton rubrum CBS 118892]EZF27763.1 hypothetical protein H100_00248 [Trichophyton rubrum MR850]EZF46883.1 hypothetical protein H102_00246 [Trichophyton rubrum CBS 100081]EZF57531.1 hypothetical protein H103_00246 [Trichophyton rubrum CBS 288.86]EZF68133.1 hypothetical protein H104_00246 [Trichophyton rubrum CBS 289.86]EZF78792.1 hypothetical protein H105_00239 [Trichophyton soudanense CBS 452.61]EZF89351.1 hypothetical protein H110_00248 [Trichophy
MLFRSMTVQLALSRQIRPLNPCISSPLSLYRQATRQSRYYATSQPPPLRTNAVKSKVKAPELSLKSPSPSSGAPNKFRRFEWEVSKHKGPVCLFRAPKQRSYIIGAYTTASFCYMYAGYNFYTSSIDPVLKIQWWQELLFGGICFVMAIMGTVFFRRGFGLISQINAVNLNGKTQLSIKVRRMLPFMKQRELTLAPSELSISQKVTVSEVELTKAGWSESQQRFARQRALDDTHFFKMPVQKTSLAIFRAFSNARRLFTQEHFVYVNIKGQKSTLRLDALGSFSPEFHMLQKAVVDVV